jgi:predicted MPP superfamily phosphohydrolase
MKKNRLLFILFVLAIIFINILPIAFASVVKQKQLDEKILNLVAQESSIPSDDFYFVHLTDTHVMHKIFDSPKEYKNKLNSVLNYFTSIDDKPAFFVITGDLVSIGGGIIGALNYKTFLECFYKKDGQLYADDNNTIPVYTIPGNHDYLLNLNLFNYHLFIDNKHTIRYNTMELLENRTLNDRYVIHHENLSLFFMDSGHGYLIKPWEITKFKGAGLSYWFDIEWLEREIRKDDSKHKIVLMHYPAINWCDYDKLARNADVFINLCEGYNIDLVLAGHTHASRVFDKDQNFYENDILPLNCSQYPPLYVQTEACKEGSFYRCITISGNDVWLNPTEQVK